jgi:serine/threonine-protein kinase
MDLNKCDDDVMADALAAGSGIAHYRVVSRLGEGGMGAVYLADDTRLGRRVALKILPANVAADPERMQRFLQEAKLASALTHPNVAYIYEIGEEHGLRFLAMEYVEGQPLSVQLARAARLRLPNCFRSVSRWPTRWTTRIPKVSCIAISSHPTSC